MEFIKIILLSVLAACGYGVIHDQITARVCVEYFTIGHPPIFGGIQSPTLLGLAWGVIATWWVGLPLGIIAAFCARLGPWPRMSMRQLLMPLGTLLATMAVFAFISGLTGYVLASNGSMPLTGRIAIAVSPDRHAVFMADWLAHNSSYFVGMFGGIVLAIYVLIRRLLRDREKSSLPYSQ